MQKILVIITTQFVLHGGLTNVMLNYYQWINNDKFRIDFASTNKLSDENLLIKLKKKNSQYYCLGNRKKKTIMYLIKLYRLLKNNNYDIVHINSNSATATLELLVAKIAGVKTRIVHNHTEVCDHQILHKLFSPFFKKLYTVAVACSNKSGEWIFGENGYKVLKNSIDTQRYRYDKDLRINIRQKYNIDENCMVLGHIGKIYKPKNHSFIIDIFNDYHKINKNSKLLLVGDGILRHQVEEKIKFYNIQDDVILVGMQYNTNEYLSAMDVFIFPSLWEGLPLALVEAQSSGVICVCSNKIDEQINITGNVKMLPIDDGTKIWVDAILKQKKVNREEQSIYNIDKIKKSGYDSKTNVEYLEKIYSNNET